MNQIKQQAIEDLIFYKLQCIRAQLRDDEAGAKNWAAAYRRTEAFLQRLDEGGCGYEK